MTVQSEKGVNRLFFSKDPVNPEIYDIKANSTSYYLRVTQELTGRLAKHMVVLNLEILNSENQVCLTVKQLKDDQFEALLQKGMSVYVANALIVLLTQSIWPPKPKSTGGGGGG